MEEEEEEEEEEEVEDGGEEEEEGGEGEEGDEEWVPPRRPPPPTQSRGAPSLQPPPLRGAGRPPPTPLTLARPPPQPVPLPPARPGPSFNIRTHEECELKDTWVVPAGNLKRRRCVPGHCLWGGWGVGPVWGCWGEGSHVSGGAGAGAPALLSAFRKVRRPGGMLGVSQCGGACGLVAFPLRFGPGEPLRIGVEPVLAPPVAPEAVRSPAIG